MARSSVVDVVFVEERDRGDDDTADDDDDDDDDDAAAAATMLLLPPATRRSMVAVADAKRRDIARSSVVAWEWKSLSSHTGSRFRLYVSAGSQKRTIHKPEG